MFGKKKEAFEDTLSGLSLSVRKNNIDSQRRSSDLLDKVESLIKAMDKQNELIKKLCPHKDVELSKETGAYIWDNILIYKKTCKLCGNIEAISEKEYYETQKGIVDSKLKEIDD